MVNRQVRFPFKSRVAAGDRYWHTHGSQQFAQVDFIVLSISFSSWLQYKPPPHLEHSSISSQGQDFTFGLSSHFIVDSFPISIVHSLVESSLFACVLRHGSLHRLPKHRQQAQRQQLGNLERTAAHTGLLLSGYVSSFTFPQSYQSHSLSVLHTIFFGATLVHAGSMGTL